MLVAYYYITLAVYKLETILCTRVETAHQLFEDLLCYPPYNISYFTMLMYFYSSTNYVIVENLQPHVFQIISCMFHENTSKNMCKLKSVHMRDDLKIMIL